MLSSINIKQALRVFEKITDQGQCVDGEYHYRGLIASSGYDGYTITLRNDYVTLDIFFHNKFHFEFLNKKERDGFLEKLALLDKA